MNNCKALTKNGTNCKKQALSNTTYCYFHKNQDVAEVITQSKDDTPKVTGCSKAQIEWLSNIEKNDNIYIQHAHKSGGEFLIPDIGKVDGFCKETNTVYEYHGDFWHGNPLSKCVKSANKAPFKNSFVKFGELYKRTIDRDEKIESLGYNLVTKWETNDPKGTCIARFPDGTIYYVLVGSDAKIEDNKGIKNHSDPVWDLHKHRILTKTGYGDEYDVRDYDDYDSEDSNEDCPFLSRHMRGLTS